MAEARASIWDDSDLETWDDAVASLEALEAEKQAERDRETAKEAAKAQAVLDATRSSGVSTGMKRGSKITLALCMAGLAVIAGTWNFADVVIRSDETPEPTSTQQPLQVDPTLIQPQNG